jgi:hypothetical protein
MSLAGLSSRHLQWGLAREHPTYWPFSFPSSLTTHLPSPPNYLLVLKSMSQTLSWEEGRDHYYHPYFVTKFKKKNWTRERLNHLSKVTELGSIWSWLQILPPGSEICAINPPLQSVARRTVLTIEPQLPFTAFHPSGVGGLHEWAHIILASSTTSSLEIPACNSEYVWEGIWCDFQCSDSHRWSISQLSFTENWSPRSGSKPPFT